MLSSTFCICCFNYFYASTIQTQGAFFHVELNENIFLGCEKFHVSAVHPSRLPPELSLLLRIFWKSGTRAQTLSRFTRSGWRGTRQAEAKIYRPIPLFDMKTRRIHKHVRRGSATLAANSQHDMHFCATNYGVKHARVVRG